MTVQRRHSAELVGCQVRRLHNGLDQPEGDRIIRTPMTARSPNEIGVRIAPIRNDNRTSEWLRHVLAEARAYRSKLEQQSAKLR
jgi:hypothetical protein